ncbi:MAG TPA: pyridoxal phosphate-dependent aminotransferase [Streptosporangiaceae bacterium]|nr:pyridoxal phosphate-dependent aminotransferase [Streptosporangiaceae bacterium]
MPWAGPATLTEPTSLPTPLATGAQVATVPTATRVRGNVPVSATLAANEALARRRERGEPVLPLAFGEAGLPVHPRLIAELADLADHGAYGPVAGAQPLRAAAAGYWSRRSLPTSPDAVVAGPGSKALLFATLLALGTDVAVPQPSWVSYAAQAMLIGATAHFVPTVPGEGGSCDPAALEAAVRASRRAGRPIGAVLVTLPDNPTGRLASPESIRGLCAVAERNDLIIISDEIYRDLVHDPDAAVLSPAAVAPERTVVTTALSKNLAVGGWRIGVARMPDGATGAALRQRVIGIASEIWSAASAPVQLAAAVALDEPADVAERIARSRRLHAVVCQQAARLCTAAGLDVMTPQAAFYLYPDFAPWRDRLRSRFGVATGADLAALLLDRYGAGTLPGSAFGESASCLRLRVATGLLYGDTDEQREQALAAPDPLQLPWISNALARFGQVLTDLGGLSHLAA